MGNGEGEGVGGDSERKGTWMTTFTGIHYYPIDPRAEDVDIIDIAVSLGNQCRYGGHSQRFYSVAEHSVLVSYLVPPEDTIEGLLHDATEAYVSDIIRPLKRCLGKGNPLEVIENQNYAVIAEKFGLRPELPESVHYADNQILILEKEKLHPRSGDWNLNYPRPTNVTVMCLAPYEATASFLFRYCDILNIDPTKLINRLDRYLAVGE